MPEAGVDLSRCSVRAAIALGSNLSSSFGTPSDNLHESIRRLGSLGSVASVSSFYRTVPVGYVDQPDFVNAALLLDTPLAAEELMRGLLAVEWAMGRRRGEAVVKGPRIIDLDLLLYGSAVLHTERLTVPHPALPERAFVLDPLTEIAAQMRHPVLGKTIVELMSELKLEKTGG